MAGRSSQSFSFAPHCDEPLRRDRPDGQGRAGDDVGKRGRLGIQVLLALLAGVGGLATMVFFLAALVNQKAQAAVFGLVLLLFLGGISTANLFYQTRHQPSKRNVGRVLFGILVFVGIGVTTGCTFIVSARVACMAGGFRL